MKCLVENEAQEVERASVTVLLVSFKYPDLKYEIWSDFINYEHLFSPTLSHKCLKPKSSLPLGDAGCGKIHLAFNPGV